MQMKLLETRTNANPVNMHNFIFIYLPRKHYYFGASNRQKEKLFACVCKENKKNEVIMMCTTQENSLARF